VSPLKKRTAERRTQRISSAREKLCVLRALRGKKDLFSVVSFVVT
jgi:hypothetical protein